MRYVPWLGRDLFHPLFSVTTSLWQVHSWPSYYSKSHKQGFSNKIQCSQIGRKLSIHNEIVSRTLSCLENFSSGYRFFFPFLWNHENGVVCEVQDRVYCQRGMTAKNSLGTALRGRGLPLPSISCLQFQTGYGQGDLWALTETGQMGHSKTWELSQCQASRRICQLWPKCW